MMTHEEAVNDLASHLLCQQSIGPYSQWIVCTEVTFRENRFDVVAINAWNSRSDIRAYEVKVQRSDLLREMREGKWSAMREAGASPYLALANGLKIKRSDLPPGLGLVKECGDSWRHEVRVDRREPTNSPALLMAMLLNIRVETTRLRNERRQSVLDYISEEQAPLAAQRAAHIAGHNLASILGWIKDNKQYIRDREEELRKKEETMKATYADIALANELEKARKLGIEAHQIDTMIKYIKGNDTAQRVYRAISACIGFKEA
jgi:hypothetical protein